MKKITRWLIATAALLLLAACEPVNTVEPTQAPECSVTPTVEPTVAAVISPTTGLSITPTPDIMPSLTPDVTPSPIPSAIPEVTPSAAPSPTPETVPSVTPSPTPSPTPSATPSPSPIPSATPSPTPSLSPVPSATPSATPSPTPSPTPSATPSPSPTPTPTVNPEPLVMNGWQKTVSIDEAYTIVFPELYRSSEISRTDRELIITYLDKEDPEIKFLVQYRMNHALEETQEEILQAGGEITEQIAPERRISYLLRKEDVLYQGILLEAQYSKQLLGEAFGEEEWVTGIMNVVFACPAERSTEYQTEQYSFYVVKNGEEN